MTAAGIHSLSARPSPSQISGSAQLLRTDIYMHPQAHDKSARHVTLRTKRSSTFTKRSRRSDAVCSALKPRESVHVRSELVGDFCQTMQTPGRGFWMAQKLFWRRNRTIPAPNNLGCCSRVPEGARQPSSIEYVSTRRACQRRQVFRLQPRNQLQGFPLLPVSVSFYCPAPAAGRVGGAGLRPGKVPAVARTCRDRPDRASAAAPPNPDDG